MKIVKAEPEQLEEIKNFLIPYEHSCAQLMAQVKFSFDKVMIVESDKIEGVLFWDNQLFHCIPFIVQGDVNKSTEFATEFLRLLKEKPVKCISGEKAGSAFITELMKKAGEEPAHINEYKVMILEQQPNLPPEQLNPDDEIRRCTEKDCDIILPLQKNYFIKEVVVPGSKISDLVIAMELKKTLKNQIVYVLYSDGEPVAKANTNAIGTGYIQLGGIYTEPLYRRNYYSWHLIYKLCALIIKNKRKVCLFVRNRNGPAIQLYKRIGFQEKGDFQITYF